MPQATRVHTTSRTSKWIIAGGQAAALALVLAPSVSWAQDAFGGAGVAPGGGGYGSNAEAGADIGGAAGLIGGGLAAGEPGAMIGTAAGGLAGYGIGYGYDAVDHNGGTVGMGYGGADSQGTGGGAGSAGMGGNAGMGEGAR